jgi:hypothetical protein
VGAGCRWSRPEDEAHRDWRGLLSRASLPLMLRGNTGY